MKRVKWLLCMTTLVALIFTGCSFPALSNSGNKIKVGVSVLDLANPYFVQIVNGIKEAAEPLGVEVIVNDPKSDVTQQVTGIENFISAKVDGIIVAALDPQAIDPVVKKAREAGIKVLAQSTKLDNADIFVSVEEYAMGNALGKEAGKWIAETLGGKAEVAILNYPRIPQIIDRERGIKEGIIEFAPDAKFVATASAATPEEGLKAAESILQANPNVQVIAAINDSGALGALQAMNAVHKDGNYFIGGIDATPEGLDKIREGGFFKATVDIQPLENGKYDLEAIVKLINGEQVDSYHAMDVSIVNSANIAK